VRGIVGAASGYFRSDRDPLRRIRLKTAGEIELTTARAAISRHVRGSCMTKKPLDDGGWPFGALHGIATPTVHQRGIEQGTISRL
jgi:hypothetical protein